MKLPIGNTNFHKIITEGYVYVDKTLMLKDLIDEGSEVLLFTRPRRFGKTLNMQMLYHFFAREVYGMPTRGLFDELNIAQCGNQYLQHQGQHPVIYLTLKDIKSVTYEDAYQEFCSLIGKIYDQHHILLTSGVLSPKELAIYESIINNEASLVEIKYSFKNLCEYLYRYYQTKPLIIIDEYDTPIQASFLSKQNYYDNMVDLMRGFFGAALKDNPYLYKAVLTGILRISKESLFSGLNNIKVYSLLHVKYSQYFGFTETEVSALLSRAHLEHKADAIRQWYNGYTIGDTIIYNPWSLIHCIQERGLLKPYWVNTSDNLLIRQLLIKHSSALHAELESLLQDQPIIKHIDENLVFSDLENNEAGIWSLLLLSGYLNAISSELAGLTNRCQLKIPNQEVKLLYQDIIMVWLGGNRSLDWYQEFLAELLIGKMDAFQQKLQTLFLHTVSSHDVNSQQPEKFYHGFILGLLATLYSTYEIKSNRESGLGRYDLAIIPKDKSKLGIILEFKAADKSDSTALKKAAEQALAQINSKVYIAELQQRGVQKILLIALVFAGKTIEVAYQHL